jgi:hypothetical protein
VTIAERREHEGGQRVEIIDRFVEAFNGGNFVAMRKLMAEGYTHAEPLYPGPYDAEAHIALMQDVIERAPDRRVDVTRTLPGAGAVAAEGLWVGHIGGQQLRLEIIFVFDVTETGEQIQRSRLFYEMP